MSLLDKAMDDFYDSRILYDDMKRSNPENMRLTNICYHVQQCIEKVLKRLIELKGEQYPQTHDIGELVLIALSLYKDNNALTETLKVIQTKATMYTSWEVAIK